MGKFLNSLLVIHMWFNYVTSIPEQIHISYGDAENTMFISWSTPTNEPSTVKSKSKSKTQNTTTTMTKGTSVHFRQLFNSSHPLKKCIQCVDEYLHTALLIDLLPGAQYMYQVNNVSKWYTFTNVMRNVTELSKPYTFGVYGDMGTVVPGGVVSPSLRYLTKDVEAGLIDGILHVGDLAYDMKDDGGRTGAEFMRQIEPIAAYVPYMVVPCNHEGGTPFTGSLHHYINRLRMPNYDKSRNSFYSFDVGPAHIISFSSEAYFWQLWTVEQQFAWLEKDLANVNRTKTPFIITQAHRPMYCSNTDDHDDCTQLNSTMRRGLFSGKTHEKNGLFALEPLFMKYHVDLCFWAHEHSYERMWPVYENTVMNGTTTESPYTNTHAPTHIVAGAAGCREGHDSFNGPRASWSAVRNSAYGYGRLRIQNKTHLHWEQIEDQNNSIVDEFWMVKY